MSDLPATDEYDRVRREDAWAGAYTDGTPVRLLPQSVADAMRDELLGKISDLKAALGRAKCRAYTELRHRADRAEQALDGVAALLGINPEEEVVELPELRRRIEALQCCATCEHWDRDAGECAADPMDTRSWHASSYDVCRYTPSRWQLKLDN